VNQLPLRLSIPLLVLAACDNGSPPTLGCQSDVDCKGERICVASECVFPDDAPDDTTLDPANRDASGRERDARVPDDGSTLSADASTDASVEAGCVLDCAPVTPVPPPAEGLTAVAVEASAIIGDPARRILYAVVPGSSARYANRLVTIDADTGEVAHDVPVGSEPSALALSDDGSVLWVGLAGALTVRAVDLTGPVPVQGSQYSLPAGSEGAEAGPMVVLPGSPRSLAVSLHRPNLSPSLAGVAVLDDGVARPTLAPGHTGASRLTQGPAGYLFGYNNLHTGFGFYTLTVSSTGLTQREFAGLVAGFTADIVYGHGYVYATSGVVLDVTDPLAPRRAGTFPVAGSVLPLAGDRALILSPSDSFAMTRPGLHLMDSATFTETDSLALPDVLDARSLVRAAPHAVAFLGIPSAAGAEGNVFLLRDTALVPE
jgi:hypothetical protein